jgi:hypothetical protein
VSASGVRLLFCGDVQTGPRRLRDAGHEVVVLPAGTPAVAVVAAAVQEDVDVVAVDDPELGAAVATALGGEAVVFSVTSAARPSQGAGGRD